MGGAGRLRWLVAGIVLLGAAALAIFSYSSGSASQSLTWQTALLVMAWLVSTAVAWHFLRHLPQGEIDFDGENWYFSGQFGSLSSRFDMQSSMLLRFESESKQVSWLWLEEKFAPTHWDDLRRAVYSRAVSTQNISSADHV